MILVRHRRWLGVVALAVALLVACGDDDDDDGAGDTTTTAPADTGTTAVDTTDTTEEDDSDGGSASGDCPLTAEEVSEIVGSAVEEDPELRTGSDCQYGGGGLHVVLGVRGTSGLSPDEFIEGNEEVLGEEAERVDGVGDEAAFFGSGADTLLAFADGQVISVLGAPTREAAMELAEAVIAGL